MKIIIDAMGGDHAPQATVEGGIMAAQEFGLDVVLVGRVAEILSCIEQLGHGDLPKGIAVADATEVVTMDDDPANVIREKKDSSLSVGLRMLRDGEGDAFVSAGNTGALLAGATLIPKRIKGIRRAALAPVIPNRETGALVIDCGANAECTPEYLLQFAYMGAYYAKNVMGQSNPRVGLLNNGSEPSKGTELQRETYALLETAREAGKLNFIGNVEGREVMLGGVDVVVTDGFTGNILLKTIEGTAMCLMGELKDALTKSTKTKLGALLVKSGLRGLKKKLDHAEIGGTVLLGISKPVIKAHGNSTAYAIRSAIRQARDITASGIIQDIRDNIDEIKLEKE
ncbi:MAG: phosphate acyltransferase PlsX [Oscillospiraceae bacterium]|nr:phosphate acyltransferase PlsX [Oscillospiraceae bacterium]